MGGPKHQSPQGIDSVRQRVRKGDGREPGWETIERKEVSCVPKGGTAGSH